MSRGCGSHYFDRYTAGLHQAMASTGQCMNISSTVVDGDLILTFVVTCSDMEDFDPCSDYILFPQGSTVALISCCVV